MTNLQHPPGAQPGYAPRDSADWYAQEIRQHPGLSLRDMAILAMLRAEPRNGADGAGFEYGSRLVDAASLEWELALADPSCDVGDLTAEIADLKGFLNSLPNRFIDDQGVVLWLSTGAVFECIQWLIAAVDVDAATVSIEPVRARDVVLGLSHDRAAAAQARQATLDACSVGLGREDDQTRERRDEWLGAMQAAEVTAAAGLTSAQPGQIGAQHREPGTAMVRVTGLPGGTHEFSVVTAAQASKRRGGQTPAFGIPTAHESLG